MASALNLHATVTTPERTYPDPTQIVVRLNVATLSDGHGVLLTKEDVTAVERPDIRTWTVTFGDGTMWTAVREKKRGGG